MNSTKMKMCFIRKPPFTLWKK